jgi:hypothetical protein
VIEGCEAAWRFFGGVFRVLIPDNASAIVADADAVNPHFTVGWLDYTQHCGFSTDAARVHSPKDKPRVERAVQYVRGNFFAGEEFVDLADAQTRAEKWCHQVAGGRIHGSTQARPVQVFAEHEASALLAVPEPYDVPILTRIKVHRDSISKSARRSLSVFPCKQRMTDVVILSQRKPPWEEDDQCVQGHRPALRPCPGLAASLTGDIPQPQVE